MDINQIKGEFKNELKQISDSMTKYSIIFQMSTPKMNIKNTILLCGKTLF